MLDQTRNYLTEQEREYIHSMGTEDRAMSIEEFTEFWDSASACEKGTMRRDFQRQYKRALL